MEFKVKKSNIISITNAKQATESVVSTQYTMDGEPVCPTDTCVYLGRHGRRHGFESGGTILRAERAQKILTPTFWPVGGGYCLDG